MDLITTGLLCPFGLSVDSMAGMLNAELSDHPVYDGVELQWFDDDVHGAGMLVFLSRRANRLVDYYVDPALRLDRSNYAIGGGTGEWVLTDFDVARLDIDADGVVAEVRFTDLDGRPVEVAVDDRGAGPRHAATLLAPVSSAIDHPTSLLLVHLRGFDLLRRTDRAPRIRIDGQDAAIGSLPGRSVHRRHLIKVAAPVTIAKVCQSRTGPVVPVDPDEPGAVLLDVSASGIIGMTACGDGSDAVLSLDPPLPPLGDLPDGVSVDGGWQVSVDGAPMTGGRWRALRQGQEVALGMAVTRPWEPPPGLPMLMRIVTRVAPVFRRWPTTYRWTAEVDLSHSPARVISRWERTDGDRGGTYRRLTRSRSLHPSTASSHVLL